MRSTAHPAAEAAFAGPLRHAIDGPGRFSLDGEVVRVRIDSQSERNHWHGWHPSAEGAESLIKEEPMVAVVHGILRRGRLLEFVRNNMHAASRAAHHPGHRGSIDISAQLPFEHTSISLWKSYALALDFAYKPGRPSRAAAHSASTRNRSRSYLRRIAPASDGLVPQGERRVASIERHLA
jgi:hypothetical protein